MESTLYEVYYDVERAIDYAFRSKFVLKFYDYLKIKELKKSQIEEFIESKTASNINDLIEELSSYIEGGSDNQHKQLREAYGHLSKPEARKIKNYLQGILDDAQKYNYEKRKGRRKKRDK